MREEPLFATLPAYFDHIALSEKQIAQIISYLKEIHESKAKFHIESLETLRKEQDRLQRPLNQIYDDKLDGLIEEKMDLEGVSTYKNRQAEIVE